MGNLLPATFNSTFCLSCVHSPIMWKHFSTSFFIVIQIHFICTYMKKLWAISGSHYREITFPFLLKMYVFQYILICAENLLFRGNLILLLLFDSKCIHIQNPNFYVVFTKKFILNFFIVFIE